VSGCQLAAGVVWAFRDVMADVQLAMETGGLVIDIAQLLAGGIAKLFSGQVNFGLAWTATLQMIALGDENFDLAFTDHVYNGLLCSVFDCVAYDGMGDPYLDENSLTCILAGLEAWKQGATQHEQLGLEIWKLFCRLAKAEGLSNLGIAYGNDAPDMDCVPCAADGTFVGVYAFAFSGLSSCGW
jgi:hypothetical protein